MIGRFSKLGEYQELLQQRETLQCLAGGGFALASYLWESFGLAPAWAAQVLALAAVALTGLPIIWGAAQGLMERRVNVDELVALAITASLIQGEILTAAIVGFIMSMGSLLEEAISESARRSIQSLARMTPQEATLLGPDGPNTVPVKDILPGQRLLVRPGERIPVDGVIVSGSTAVDESTITGESVPRERTAGDNVLASTLNYNGVIEIEAGQVGADTTLGRVMRLVEEAEAHKPKAVRFVDSYARWFTPLVLTLAGIAWAVSGDPNRAVAVLVAGCPCALLLAAPTATVAAVARAARSGVLIKGGAQMEAAARADAALFDKTGTLTLGEPRVEEIAPAQGVDEATVLAAAAGVERHCSHPLARAVLRAASERGVAAPEAEGVVAEVGLGVRGTLMLDGAARAVEVGGPALLASRSGEAALPPELATSLAAMRQRGATALIVLADGVPLGLLAVSDTARPTALGTCESLRCLGFLRLGMLSGDEPAPVARMAESLSLTERWSGLKPQDKLAVIRDFQSQGRSVLYVGDGVNDAPALAGADIGIAMAAAGTDVALETAGMALVRDDISRLPFVVSLSRRMLSVVKMNIGLGLLSNTVAVYGGMTGLLSPIAASLFHNGGSILVVLASASLLLYKDRSAGA
ncbi:MAG TPA: cation-translocating P-type ATPase [Humidesulfovibrio sp.]|uniref:heavy metal translocating P-type ATPase n=1 Tax=Humidesulfovibrio sp. TaxID=2910988 RepID=UPI002C9EB194|nr:cation-translocating P-type ATPase [Humidesulfovibrio sp.]HWR03371.1 cation-translocating P-type ATPase [Humidesulfovibrio sp.]